MANHLRDRVGTVDKTIRIWDAQIGKQQTHRLNGHRGNVRPVAFSSDGQWIASGSYDKTVCVWNSETGRTVGLPLTGHTNLVMGVSFSPDNLRFMSGSTDSTIRISQKPSQQITAAPLSRQLASSPEDRISLEGHPSVMSASCSVDGSLYASTLDGHLHLGYGP